jgi:SAM-dependent methyltransferase
MTDWRNYIAGFHALSPGITEDVLSRAAAGGLTPYDWLARAVAPDVGRLLDLACGSGPMAQVLADAVPGRRTAIVGLDLSSAELRRAVRTHGLAGRLVEGDAAALPFMDDSFDAVVSSMSMMVVERYPEVLRECARVLRPGGVLAMTVATAVPLRSSDVALLTRLGRRLLSRPQFPGGLELTGLRDSLTATGFRLLEDARERFVFRVRCRADADLVMRSLYLPGTPDKRREQTAAWLAARPSVDTSGIEIPVPIRRVVAVRQP